jgi:hypothetical protein
MSNQSDVTNKTAVPYRRLTVGNKDQVKFI